VDKIREIDQFDEKLLRNLQRNGRATSFELAEATGLSASSCQRRQRELEQRGIVRGYRAEIDPVVLGQAFTVFAAVQLQRHERSEVAPPWSGMRIRSNCLGSFQISCALI
jgi:Lrp/AsnC family transcriptional regulator, leucine-responsive regulatory protein